MRNAGLASQLCHSHPGQLSGLPGHPPPPFWKIRCLDINFLLPFAVPGGMIALPFCGFILVVLIDIDGSHQGGETKIHMKRKREYPQGQIFEMH